MIDTRGRRKSERERKRIMKIKLNREMRKKDTKSNS